MKMEDNQLSMMGTELYKAAMYGDDQILDNLAMDDKYFLKKTYVGNTILHLAIKFGHLNVAEKAVLRFPHLMWEKNKFGSTALHLAAELRDAPHVDLGKLETIVRKTCDELTDPQPLRIGDSQGNTALHVALIHNRLEVAHVLVNRDPVLARLVNNYGEAPLHLAMKDFPHQLENPDDDMNEKQQNFMRLMEQKETNWNKEVNVQVKEKMGMMISLLLEKAGDVACWRDGFNGMTPLHCAASLPPFYNLQVLRSIIECCPQSVEVCDDSGKTILHHLVNRIQYVPEGEDFLRKTLVYSLKNHQDNKRNTPFHLSVIHNDIVMVKLLYLIFDADTLLKNKKGQSPISLLEQDNYKVLHEEKRMTEEICHRAEYGDVFALEQHLVAFGPQFFESLDSNGKNVIHKLFLIKSGDIIIPNEFLAFIGRKQVPPTLTKPDNNGDTPIHILARLNPNSIMIHLATGLRDSPTYKKELYPGPKPNDPKCFLPSYQKYFYIWELLGRASFLETIIVHCISVLEPGTLPQNNQGNTALHEAILARNYQFFIKFAEFYTGATALVNNHNETLLHLLAPLNPTPSVAENIMDDIIKDNTRHERHLCNKDGLSPLVIAIQAGNIEFAERLVSGCPRLAEVRSPQGQTFWHLLVKVPLVESFDFENSSFTREDVLRLLDIKDYDEKTALHLAIEHRRFDVAQLFLRLHESSPSNRSRKFNTRLLQIPNKEGDTPGDLIGSLLYLPLEFENFIWKDSTMIGTRSMWGIPTMQMKDYVNTMGVIAALLTTITFTAAFTVPGGLDQEKGTPLLINDTAFQVFIISDVLAMCLSMMVLFCLLWIMATGDKTRSVVLLDFSIILLLASFYTTMLTFMTGLYATFHHVKPWIAVFSLVPCSLLLLLMHKYLVIKLIIPSGKLILIFVDKAYHSAKDAFQYANDLRQRFISRIKNCCPWISSPMPTPTPQSQDAHAV